MNLLLDRLTTTPQEHRLEAPGGWWDEWRAGAREYDYQVLDAYVFELTANRMGEDVHLVGTLSGAIEVECSRCLKRYRHRLQDDFRLVLEPAGDRLPPDPEGLEALERYGLCLGEDLEVGWYRGKELQLDAFFAEVVSLAMPIQPLCRESCAGLCPHCGIDRSEESCDCTELTTDSPFAVLAALREGSGGDS